MQESISSLNETLIPFRDQVSEVVGQVEDGASDVEKAVHDAAASSQRQQIDQLIRELETLGPDNRRGREVAAAASRIAQFF